MIRLPKRTASADSAEELDDDDLLLEVDDPGESEQTHQLLAVDAEAAALAIAQPPRAVPDAVPVGQVMASLEAEMSRALSDDKAAWVSRTRSSAPPPSASALPAIPSAPRLPAFAAPVVSAPVVSAPVAAPPEAAPPEAAPPEATAASSASPPGEPPPAQVPQVVVVREKPAFAWIIACLALGALGAVVGMRVASGLSRDGVAAPAPTSVVTAPPAASAPAAPVTASAAATPVTSAPVVPAAAVVSFDERDAVRVGRPRPVAPVSAAEVLGLSPSPPSAPPPPSAKPSADGPPPLVPDPPRAAPPPPPPKPSRPKSAQEQLLEAQLKASER